MCVVSLSSQVEQIPIFITWWERSFVEEHISQIVGPNYLI